MTFYWFPGIFILRWSNVSKKLLFSALEMLLFLFRSIH
jgi:hypothetical protein